VRWKLRALSRLISQQRLFNQQERDLRTLDVITGVFAQPLPVWIQQIKAGAMRKISAASFAGTCRQGDISVMRGLVVGLWPFVDQFPKTIIRAVARSQKNGLFQDRRLLNTMLRHGPDVLTGIRRDEENHRKLWINTGEALGLAYPSDFKRPVLSETQAWINVLNAEAEPATVFVRFAAIEIVAEAVSVEFLASKAFVSALGEPGSEWFRVHAEHDLGMTHEELELRLAFACAEGLPDEVLASSIIQYVVDAFLAAAEASSKLYVSK